MNAALHFSAKNLKTLAKREGFAAPIDNIFGTFTIWKKDWDGTREIDKRGSMGKVPRLAQGLPALERLTSAPIFLDSALARVNADANKLDLCSLCSSPSTKTSTSESSDKPTSPVLSFSSSTKSSTSESFDTDAVKALRERTATTPNPLARMRRASSLFYHQHNRYAVDEHELVRFYDAENFNTGEDVSGKRLERARMALGQHRLTERRRHLRRYVESDYLPIIHQHVSQAHRTSPSLKYKYRLDDDLLAAALYAYTKAAFAKNRLDRMHTLSDEGMVAMLSKLSKAGAVKAAFRDKEKRVAVRQILQLAGLIVLRDGNHVHGGREHGVAHKWGLGPSHPRLSEFVKSFGHIVDTTSPYALREMRRAA